MVSQALDKASKESLEGFENILAEPAKENDKPCWPICGPSFPLYCQLLRLRGTSRPPGQPREVQEKSAEAGDGRLRE